MAFVDVEYGMGGGTTLNPQVVYYERKKGYASQTVTLDPSKTYLYEYNYVRSSYITQSQYYQYGIIKNGTITVFANNGWSEAEMKPTISNNVLTFPQTDVNYENLYCLIQLD